MTVLSQIKELHPEVHGLDNLITSNEDKYARMDDVNSKLLVLLNEKLDLINQAIQQEEDNHEQVLDHPYWDLPETDIKRKAIAYFVSEWSGNKLHNLKCERDSVQEAINNIEKSYRTFGEDN